jgi:hypothetical protein
MFDIPMKVKVTMELNFDKTPDDRGTVDIWIKNTLKDVLDNEEEFNVFSVLKLKWELPGGQE